MRYVRFPFGKAARGLVDLLLNSVSNGELSVVVAVVGVVGQRSDLECYARVPGDLAIAPTGSWIRKRRREWEEESRVAVDGLIVERECVRE